MTTSLAALTWIGWLWMVWGGLALIGLAFALHIEITSGMKVQGAAGWMFFAWMMLTGTSALLISFALLIVKIWRWLH